MWSVYFINVNGKYITHLRLSSVQFLTISVKPPNEFVVKWRWIRERWFRMYMYYQLLEDRKLYLYIPSCQVGPISSKGQSSYSTRLGSVREATPYLQDQNTWESKSLWPECVDSDDLRRWDVVAHYGSHKKALGHLKAVERATLGVSLRNRYRTRVPDIAEELLNLRGSEWATLLVE